MGCNKSKAAVVESHHVERESWAEGVTSPVHEHPRPSEDEPPLDLGVVWGGGTTILAHRGFLSDFLLLPPERERRASVSRSAHPVDRACGVDAGS